ncbi:p74 [Venturia canescens]|uniref:P74 n=1 Tax=Venturia canescens TaxID=32260 RepID=A0ACB9ZHL0_9HYME|nr:uncharacterized LOC122408850 [Venturia canescens]KAI5630628.1 p74 [Venturia canescens]
MTASYTKVDRNNAIKYSEANLTILKINKIYQKARHLASHLEYQIRDATDDDFYVPAALSNSSKVVTVSITKNLCELLSCNPAKEKSMCHPKEAASYYYVGDDKYDLQCQPACYNITKTGTFDENGKRTPDTPILNWHNRSCRIVTPMVTSMEKTFYRDTTKYVPRKNDMPTGFSRIDSGDIYGSGWAYKFNKTYCEYYDKRLEANGCCTRFWYEEVFSFFGGYNWKSAARQASTGVPFNMPKLEPLPKDLPKRFTVEGWKNNNNENFKVPDLIDTAPKNIRAADIKHERHKREAVYQRERNINLNYGSDSDETHLLQDRIKTKETFSDSIGEFFRLTMERETNDTNKPSNAFATDTYTRLIKGFDKIGEKMGNLGDDLIKDMAWSLGENVASVAVEGITVRSVGNFVYYLGSDIFAAIDGFMGSGTSTMAWTVVNTALLGLYFMYADPFGYKNEWTPKLPQEMMEKGEASLRRKLGLAVINFEFENLVRAVLTYEEILDLEFQVAQDIFYYLDALEVNSDGVAIDKGSLIYFGSHKQSTTIRSMTKVLASRVKFNEKVYEEYNRVFMIRVDVNRYMNRASLGAIIGAGVFTLLYLPILAVFFFFVALILLSIGRLSLQSNLLVDALLEIRGHHNTKETSAKSIK